MDVLLTAVVLAQSALTPILDAPHWIGTRPTTNEPAGKVVLVDVVPDLDLQDDKVSATIRSLVGH